MAWMTKEGSNGVFLTLDIEIPFYLSMQNKHVSRTVLYKHFVNIKSFHEIQVKNKCTARVLSKQVFVADFIPIRKVQATHPFSSTYFLP
jgi:hypothetical protein